MRFTLLKSLRGQPVLMLALALGSIATLTRLGLALTTGPDQVPWALWPGIFLHGLVFDLAVLSWLVAPVLVLQVLRRPAPRPASAWRRAAVLAFFWLGLVFGLFVALAEWTFWEEFSTRFNFIAVDYLIYTHEVIGNIVESYPVVPLLAGIALLASVATWALRGPLTEAARDRTGRPYRNLLALLLPVAAWTGVDIDQMRFSDNAYANELSGNGLMTFLAAARRNELDYDRFYLTLPQPEADRILAGLGVERKPLSQALAPGEDEAETFAPGRLPFRKPPRNIVLISVESLSAKYLGALGGRPGLTPRLDALARDSLLFTRVYATGTRTVRGLEALTLGTPPIPGQAIVRRPGNAHLATLGEILHRQGWDTLFLYGGYGYFDNMNAFFAGNDYLVLDRTDFPEATVGFQNVWGVADEFLYDNTLARLDASHASGKPFLAQVMTTSNHRPYTYPDGRIDIASPGGRRGAVKYTDHALGRFIDQARAKPWFADTLFVITADHCASVAGKTELPVQGYHIPLLFYAPALLKPGRDDRLLSQIDLPPTLLDSVGLPGDDHFFGKSVFEQRTRDQRAFISNYQSLGYLKDGRLTVLGPKRRVEAYTVDASNTLTPTAVDPTLRDEAIAYYQTGFRAFKSQALRLP
ncbi:MAG: LTA synthase family protein [Pseudomonadota bacterium]